MEQLTLSFESGISRRHRSLLDCCTERIYKTGLVKVAGDVDLAPSNLSNALGGGDRKFGVDHLEKYIEKNKDFEPIYYLIDRFLKDQDGDAAKSAAVSRLEDLQSQISSVLTELREDT